MAVIPDMNKLTQLLNGLRKKLNEFWEPTLSEEGSFEHVFGTGNEALRIELWWDEDQLPVVSFSAPNEEELDDRYYPEGVLVDLEALVMAEQDLLWREPPAIAQFAHSIFDFLSSYFPNNKSFRDPLYDEWHELSMLMKAQREDNEKAVKERTAAAKQAKREKLAAKRAEGDGAKPLSRVKRAQEQKEVEQRIVTAEEEERIRQERVVAMLAKWAEENRVRQLESDRLERLRQAREATSKEKKKLNQAKKAAVEQWTEEEAVANEIWNVEHSAKLAATRETLYVTLGYPRVFADAADVSSDAYFKSFAYYLENVYTLQSGIISWTRAQLPVIPLFVAEFRCVHEVNLSENDLSGHALASLCALPNLKKLILNNNKLKRLPKIWLCPLLEVLDVHDNLLTELPDFSRTPLLSSMDASNNQLTEFPTGLEKCRKLFFVSLAGNRITHFPPEKLICFKDFPALNFFSLRLNPVEERLVNTFVRQIADSVATLFPNTQSTNYLDRFAKNTIRYDLYHNLYKTQLLTDVVIKSSEGTNFKAHAFLLSARCQFLKERLETMDLENLHLKNPENGDSKTTGAVLVDIPNAAEQPPSINILSLNFDSYQVNALLEYIYGDKFTRVEQGEAGPAEREKYEKLVAVALSCGLDHLAALVEAALNFKVDPENGSTFDADLKSLYKRSNDFDVSFLTSPSSAQSSEITAESSTSGALPGAGKNLIHAHRAILGARSQYMRALLTGGMLETKQRIIKIDVEYESLESVVEFCYTDDVLETLKPDFVVPLSGVSRQFNIPLLQKLIENVVGISLDVHNVSSILTLGLQDGMKDLVEICKQFILSNWHVVTTTTGNDWESVDETIKAELLEIAISFGMVAQISENTDIRSCPDQRNLSECTE